MNAGSWMGQVARWALLGCALGAMGCGGKLREVSIYNATRAPISIDRERSRTSDIAPGTGFRRLSVQDGETLKVMSGGKLVEEVKVGEAPLDFKPDADDHVLWIAGGPAPLAVANYADFYKFPDSPDVPNPKLRDLVDLRGKRSTHLERGDELWWPGPQPDKVYVTKGQRPRLMRLMPVPPELPAERIPSLYGVR